MFQNNKCPRCGNVLEEHGICLQCGYRYDDPYQGHPMKWYGFVIYVQLFAGIISNAITGVSLFSGSVFGEAAYHIYELFPFMLIFNRSMGVGYFALCFVVLFTRNELKHLKKDAPFYLRTTRLLTLALGLLSGGGMLVISNLGIAYLFQDISTLSSIFSISIMILLEKRYFDRRSDIFIN